MKQVLLLCVIVTIVTWSVGGSTGKGNYHGSRQERLSLELNNDRVQSNREGLDRITTATESGQIDLREAFEQSDLIRIQVDERLENNFPTLPRTEIDNLADQLNSRLRGAKSPEQAQEALAGLTELHTYIFSLNPKKSQSKGLFERNISARLRLLTIRPV